MRKIIEGIRIMTRILFKKEKKKYTYSGWQKKSKQAALCVYLYGGKNVARRLLTSQPARTS